MGRLTKVIQTLDGRRLETEYGYDSAGRLIWQEDANNNRTSYEYDLLGRRTVVQLPTGERSVTTYDEVGNVATVTDFNSETIQFVYDEQNRLETKDLPDDVDIQYAYTPDGQVASITDERGTTIFDYDAQGRLIARKDPVGPYINGNSIEYEYDDAGNITQVRTAAGVVDYTYDEQNRLETVTEDGETTTYLYDLAGNLKETQFPNGVIERRTYDELNRLDVLETWRGNTLLSRFDYALNDAGHRLEVVESVRQPDGTLAERTVRYEYDDLYRLISSEVVGGDTVTYTYDDVGNRLSKTANGVTTTYTYDENDRLLEEVVNGVVVASYTYDNNGNTRSRTVNGVMTNYVWDDQNRMVEVQTPTETVTYKYDDDNIRVSETTVSGTKNYVLDKNRPYAQVLAEYEGGNLEASYTYGLDLIEQERDGNESYYHVDGLGSTRGLTDESGNVTDTYTYDAYENVVGVAGTTENSYLFAGEQFDGMLGQYYLRQRYYDPTTGRFTRRDTYEGSINDPVSLHKYIYANSNPVHFVDPSGLASQDDGNEIAAVIQLHFWVEDPLRRNAEHSIKRIWKNIDIDPKSIPTRVVYRKKRDAIPDLVDYRNREIYEIGTLKMAGIKRDKMDNVYLPAINDALDYLGRTPDWTGGERFIPPPIVVTPDGKIAVVSPSEQGVIVYQILHDGYAWGVILEAIYTISVLQAQYIESQIKTSIALTKGYA